MGALSRRHLPLFIVASFLLLTIPPMALSVEQPGYGPQPSIPAPKDSWFPTVKWSVANEPWPKDAKPKAARGLVVRAFAQGLKHPRWLHVLPNGDVLVAEASTEPEPSWSPRSILQTWVQRRSGAIAENANRISLLRDTDGDGVADQHHVFLEGLRQPFGMALIGDQLYVANTDSVVRFPYRAGDARITDKGTKLLDLPVGHHWTRALLASNDGSKLYVTVGSGSNIAEKGMDIEVGRATILEFDIASNRSRIFASGLRNANGMAFEPTSGMLWTVVNERDELGDDLRPTTSRRSRMAAFMAGLTAIGVRRWTRASSRSAQISSRRPLHPTTRWVGIPPRSVLPTTRVLCCRHPSVGACSSGSMARGIGPTTAGTRSCSFPTRMLSRMDCLSTC